MIDLAFPDGNEEELRSRAKSLGFSDVCFAYPVKKSGSAVICPADKAHSLQNEKLLIGLASADPLADLKQGRVHALLGLEGAKLTQVHCKLAIENDVAFCIGLSQLREPRSLHYWHRMAKLINKYKVPLLLGSFASNPDEMRSPLDLMGLYSTIGIEKGLVKKGIGKVEFILKK